MSPKRVLAIVGPGHGAALDDIAAAERVAELAARAGWTIVCGGRSRAEVALAIKAGKPVVLVRPERATREFFARLGPEQVRVAPSADLALAAPYDEQLTTISRAPGDGGLANRSRPGCSPQGSDNSRRRVSINPNSLRSA